MTKRQGPRYLRRMVAVGVALLAFLVGGCVEEAAPGSSVAGQGSDGVAPLQPTTVALQSQVAALQTQVAALSAEVGDLRAAAAAPKASPVLAPGPAAATAGGYPPTRPAPPASPTPIPPVVGLAVSGTTKGLASAKVTITEYSDFR